MPDPVDRDGFFEFVGHLRYLEVDESGEEYSTRDATEEEIEAVLDAWMRTTMPDTAPVVIHGTGATVSDSSLHIDFSIRRKGDSSRA